MTADNFSKLYYVTDPLCSWCYGFTPQVNILKDSYPHLPFELIMGGLRPFGKSTMESLGDFLKQHWQTVNLKTGQPFGYEILKDQGFIYDTEPPCRAIVTVREMEPTLEFEFFKLVQKAFYQENQNTNEKDIYLPIINSLGLDPLAFSVLFESKNIRDKTVLDFKQSASLGVRSFPTLLIWHNHSFHLVTRGYQEAGPLIESVRIILDS